MKHPRFLIYESCDTPSFYGNLEYPTDPYSNNHDSSFAVDKVSVDKDRMSVYRLNISSKDHYRDYPLVNLSTC